MKKARTFTSTGENLPSEEAARTQILLSGWCAVVVERILEKLVHFPGAGAATICPENFQNG
jgi:hypothetical protein